MKNSVFEFIQSGLEAFSDNGGIYDRKMKSICKDLNKSLNKVNTEDYENYIRGKEVFKKIKDNISTLFNLVKPYLYVNLDKVIDELQRCQRNNDIIEKDYRDHYLHSIQCFLLSITLLSIEHIKNTCNLDIKKVIYILFTITMYHDIGYLYKIKDVKENNLNKSMRDILRSKDKLIIGPLINDLLCLNEKLKTDREHIEYRAENIVIDTIWEETPNNDDLESLKEITGNVFKIEENKDKHSFLSAVFLSRIMRTKQELSRNGNNIKETIRGIINTSIITDENEINLENDFKIVILSILFHGYGFKPPINFSNYFLSTYLIMIDELQNYGRIYSDIPEKIKKEDFEDRILRLIDDEKVKNHILSYYDLKGNDEYFLKNNIFKEDRDRLQLKQIIDSVQFHKPINPQYVGFLWDDARKKLKLEVDEAYLGSITNENLKKEYQKHSNDSVHKKLKDKIKEEDLEFLMV